MTTLTAGAQSSLTIPAGQTLSGTGNGLLVYGPGDRNGVPVGLTGSWAIGPVPAAQVVYLTATTDLVFTVGLPVAPGGGGTTLPGMQSAFDAGTPAQQVAFQASVSGGYGKLDSTSWLMATPAVASSPPTVARGAANGSTQISGSVLVPADRPGAFRFLGGPKRRTTQNPNFNGYNVGQYPQITSTALVSVEASLYLTDATGRFEIYPTNKYRW